jgi:hypothetical protein
MPVVFAIGRWLLALAPGYFFNDVMTWIGNLFGWSKNSEGKYSIWQVLLVIAALTIAVWFLVKKVFKIKL